MQVAIDARRKALANITKPKLEDYLAHTDKQTLDLIASFQRAIVEDLAAKTLAAADACNVATLFVTGGVAANQELRQTFERDAAEIDLVILDLGMPGMGGEEVLPELKRIRPKARVVLSSGFSKDDAIAHFSHLPAIGFIQKPYTAGSLASQVKKALAATEKLEGAR